MLEYLFPAGFLIAAFLGAWVVILVSVGSLQMARRFPDVPVVPVYLHGLGKAMPKGTLVPVPFYVKVAVGQVLRWHEDKSLFMNGLRQQMDWLQHKVCQPAEEE